MEDTLSIKFDETIEFDSSKLTEELIVEEDEEINISTVTLNPLLNGIIRVYQNSIPWSNRTNATLLSLGKILGVDYFIHPLSDLAKGIPLNTKVVLIASNSAGSALAAAEENLNVAQINLKYFVNRGGVLIVDMADNLSNGGYIAPGSKGTPNLIFPDNAQDYKLFLTPTSYFTTFVNGPTLTLSNDNISMDPNTRYSAHGNLVDGITLPKKARILMTAIFGGINKPVLAYYPLCRGYVIVDTITKEFFGQAPVGNGPTNIITNLIFFAYHLSNLCK